MPSARLLKIENATVKHRNQVLFSGLNLEIRKNEHWAVVGAGGSGKSALLKTLAGKFFVSNGKITHFYYEDYIKTHPRHAPLFNHRSLISYVDIRHDFTNLSNTMDFYYQQRFNAGHAENALTVEDYLKDRAGPGKPDAQWPLARVYEAFSLEQIRRKHLIKLSNGEIKRLRIGAALLKNPAILLLDTPLAGLDIHTREKFDDVFFQIAASGICLVMATDPINFPKVITHVAVLNRNRQLTNCKKQDFQPLPMETGTRTTPDSAKLRQLMSRTDKRHFEVLVSMKNVRIAYGDTEIFRNINWKIRPGNRWALSGPNGSGKSTLLSLINGDHPQAYANDIVLFDRKRGSGESIWDIKKRIGFMSPELFQYFPNHFTCAQVVESGLYDTLGMFGSARGTGRRSSRERAGQWMDIIGLASISEHRLSEVPAGQQRLCLLARALVKNPYLLILDEPCLGFDRYRQQEFRHLIDVMAESADFSLIYVTHQQETLPACITNTFRLGEGANGQNDIINSRRPGFASPKGDVVTE